MALNVPYAGAMANAIASVDMVIALGKKGLMGSFGAAGLVRSKLESAVDQIQAALPNGPYAFNLIHSPNEPALERNAVDVYLSKSVRVIEASAFLDITLSAVLYRAAGLKRQPDGTIEIGNHIIAKVPAASSFKFHAACRESSGACFEGRSKIS